MSESGSKPTCETCRFWDKDSPTKGTCHRYPPTVITITESKAEGSVGEYREAVDSFSTSEFPDTLATEWCGEHVVRE